MLARMRVVDHATATTLGVLLNFNTSVAERTRASWGFHPGRTHRDVTQCHAQLLRSVFMRSPDWSAYTRLPLISRALTRIRERRHRPVLFTTTISQVLASDPGCIRFWRFALCPDMHRCPEQRWTTTSRPLSKKTRRRLACANSRRHTL